MLKINLLMDLICIQIVGRFYSINKSFAYLMKKPILLKEWKESRNSLLSDKIDFRKKVNN